MTDHPIIFSAPMVKALLENRKTMTRRLLSAAIPPAPAMDSIHPKNVAKYPAPYLDAYCSERKTDANPRGMSRRWCWWTRDDRQCLPTFDVKYAPGDRLYVREAHALIWPGETAPERIDGHCIEYRADTDGRCLPGQWPDEERGNEDRPRWRPSIHMPRWASRLTLTVTAVKIEQLRFICHNDLLREGVFRAAANSWTAGDNVFAGSAYAAFQGLWNRLHGAGAWERNPDVCVIQFSCEQRNIDAVEPERARGETNPTTRKVEHPKRISP